LILWLSKSLILILIDNLQLLTLLGISVTITEQGHTPETDLVSDNQLDDYSYISEDLFTTDHLGVLLRCTSGLGHQNDTSLGGWYFNDIKVETGDVCGSVFQMSSTYDTIYHDLYPCGPLSSGEEGVYTCVMKDSSMTVQFTRVGLYLNGRSESLDIYRGRELPPSIKYNGSYLSIISV